MLTLRQLSRTFAVAIAGIGVLQLIFQQVLAGRPAAVNSHPTLAAILAFPSAVALIACGIQLWLARPARWLFIGTSIFIFACSGIPNLFVVVRDADYGGVLTSFGKAITLGAALLLFMDLSTRESGSRAFAAARICLGLFLAIGGVQHFLFAGFVRFLVPRWIPFDLFWTYAAGVALIASGLCLMFRYRVGSAGVAAGLMVFIWVVVLHIPRAVSTPDANELTAVCEALAVSTILFTLAETGRKSQSQ